MPTRLPFREHRHTNSYPQYFDPRQNSLNLCYTINENSTTTTCWQVQVCNSLNRNDIECWTVVECWTCRQKVVVLGLVSLLQVSPGGHCLFANCCPRQKVVVFGFAFLLTSPLPAYRSKLLSWYYVRPHDPAYYSFPLELWFTLRQ